MWAVACKVWSAECEVYSVVCKVWSVECKVWSVKCGVQSVKWGFRGRLPPIFTLCSFKIDVFLPVFLGTSIATSIDASCEAPVNFYHISQNATPVTEFAPCRHLTQPWQCDSHATRHVSSAAPPRKITMDTSKVLRLPQKMQLILRKRRKSIAPATQNDFRLCMSRSATPATRNEAKRLKPPKNDPFCRTYHKHDHTGIARTVAEGCKRLRTVADGCGRLRTARQRQQRQIDAKCAPRKVVANSFSYCLDSKIVG